MAHPGWILEWFLIGLAVVLALGALGCVVLLILDRPPRPYEPAIPDFVPDDWTGGDREQTKPDREPHR